MLVAHERAPIGEVRTARATMCEVRDDALGQLRVGLLGALDPREEVRDQPKEDAEIGHYKLGQVDISERAH